MTLAKPSIYRLHLNNRHSQIAKSSVVLDEFVFALFAKQRTNSLNDAEGVTAALVDPYRTKQR